MGAKRHVGRLLRGLWTSMTLREMSGAFGDLGTFLPLTVALVKIVGLDLGTTLIFTGLYNIASGALFGIPMPVQPMKAIAAVAIAQGGINLAEVLAAGIFVSAVTLLLGVTRLITLFNRVVPDAVVRGLQLAVGLPLAQQGIRSVYYTASQEHDLKLSGEDISDIPVVVGLVAAALLLLTLYSGPAAEEPSASAAAPGASPADPSKHAGLERQQLQAARLQPAARQQQQQAAVEGGLPRPGSLAPNRDSSTSLNHWLGMERAGHVRPPLKAVLEGVARRVPVALLVVIAGVLMPIFAYPEEVLRTLRLGPSTPRVVLPSWAEWKTGIIRAGLPQLPVTTLNSVVAVCQLSADLFPARPASPVLVATSVGLMNLAGAWFGAMPCCHGAGGLAAQVRFGASCGTAPIFLGAVKVALGLLFGSSLFQLLQAFPRPLLGSLLIFSGVELAASCTRVRDERATCLMLITAAAGTALGNVAIGFLAGEACAALLALWDVLPGWCQAACDRIQASMSRTTSASTPESSHNAGGAHQQYQALPAQDLPPEYWSLPRDEGLPPLAAQRGSPGNV